MKKFVTGFWGDEGGASAVEYALLLAIVASGIALAVSSLGEAISGAIDESADCIEDLKKGCG